MVCDTLDVRPQYSLSKGSPLTGKYTNTFSHEMDTIILYVQDVNAARRYWISLCTIVAIQLGCEIMERRRFSHVVLKHTLEFNPTLQRMANVHEHSHPGDRAC